MGGGGGAEPGLAPAQDVDVELEAAFAAKSIVADTVARTTLRCGALILIWYFLSTLLGLYNKKLVGKKHGIFGNGAFPAPLLMTSVQFFFQHLLARAVFATRLLERVGEPLSWRDWSRLVLPNGTVTGLDIGFSNASLVHITMSFYTMCKSTTPIFLLIFAFIWRLETPSWGLAGVVCVIVVGLLLLVQGEAEFDSTGFALVMSASAMSGLRFTLTQLLLHGRGNAAAAESAEQHVAGDPPDEPGNSSSSSGRCSSGHNHGGSPFGGPLEVLEQLTPVMAAVTLLLSLTSERLWVTLPGSPYFASAWHACITISLIAVGAVIAFLMVWTEYQVIKETSALTFMIAGTVKEVVTVVTAVAVFKDRFGAINGIGLAVVIGGVLLFNHYKLTKLKASVRERILSEAGAGGGGAAGSMAPHARSGGSSSGGRLQTQQSRKRGSLDVLEDAEVMRALEFEPLLPMNGVMIRR